MCIVVRVYVMSEGAFNVHKTEYVMVVKTHMSPVPERLIGM